MAENTLALLRYLSSIKSPLASLTEGYSRPTTVFFAHVGPTFFMYSFTTAKVLYTALFALSFILISTTFVDPAPALKNGHGFWREQGKGTVAVIAGMVGTLLVPNTVAFIMRHILNRGMSWFKDPMAPIGLYGPAALLGKIVPFAMIKHNHLIHPPGVMISQYLVGEVHEQSVFTALLLIESFLAIAIQLVNIGSAAIFFLAALPLFVALALNPLFVGSNSRMSLWTYGLGSILPSLTGTLLLLGVVEVFVPLVNDIPFVH
jgi:hypothetical protein